jgi:hypothetical protein
LVLGAISRRNSRHRRECDSCRRRRGAIGHYLVHLGARDAAALFTNAGATGA